MKKMLIIVDCSIFSKKIAEYFSDKYEVFCLCETEEEMISYKQKSINAFTINDEKDYSYKNADIILNCFTKIDESIFNKLFSNTAFQKKRTVFDIILNHKDIKKYENLSLNSKTLFCIKQIAIPHQDLDFKLEDYYIIFDQLDIIINNGIKSFYTINI